MSDFPSRLDLFGRFRAGALSVSGTKISVREIDRDGSDINLVAHAASILGEQIVARLAQAFANSYEDTAVGDALDRVVFDRKGLLRKAAAPSVGTVTLTRPTAAAGAGTIDGGPPGSVPTPTRIRTNRGLTYILAEPAIFGALTLSIEVEIQAVIAGIDQQVDADQVWSWVDSPFDPTITISNPEETAGAADEETDDEFKARAKAFFPTLARGTVGAIEFALRSTPGVASVTVEEVTNPSGDMPAGAVRAFVLDAANRSNQVLCARARNVLVEYRAAGIPVIVEPGEPDFVEIEFVGVEFDAAIVSDTSAAATLVRSRITAALQLQVSGATLLRSTIVAAARSVPGFIFEDTDLIEPAASLVAASPTKAFRTRPDLIAIS